MKLTNGVLVLDPGEEVNVQGQQLTATTYKAKDHVRVKDGRPKPTTGFIGRQGQTLTKDGASVGYLPMVNLYHAAGSTMCGCWLPQLGNPDGKLGVELDAMKALGIRGFRFWVFQGLTVRNGVRDWSAIDHVLAEAKARGLLVIPVLSGEKGCGEPDRHRNQTWMTTTYKATVEAGQTVPYRAYAAEAATRYKDDPTILLWQLGNEFEPKNDAETACCPTQVFVDFATDVSALVKSIDRNHLVSLGTIGSGQCGASGSDYLTVHSIPSIDVCEYHWYPSGTSYPSFPGDQYNGMSLRVTQAKALNKPLIVGEIGLRLGDFPSKDARAVRLGQIITDHRAVSVALHAPWAWCSASVAPYEDFLYQPDDPALVVLGRNGL